MDATLLERASQPDLRVDRGILAVELASLTGPYALVPRQWRLAQMGLDRTTLQAVLLDLPRFVREAGLPHSILDETGPDRDSIDRLLDPIMVLTPTDHP